MCITSKQVLSDTDKATDQLQERPSRTFCILLATDWQVNRYSLPDHKYFFSTYILFIFIFHFSLVIEFSDVCSISISCPKSVAYSSKSSLLSRTEGFVLFLISSCFLFCSLSFQAQCKSSDHISKRIYN